MKASLMTSSFFLNQNKFLVLVRHYFPRRRIIQVPTHPVGLGLTSSSGGGGVGFGGESRWPTTGSSSIWLTSSTVRGLGLGGKWVITRVTHLGLGLTSSSVRGGVGFSFGFGGESGWPTARSSSMSTCLSRSPCKKPRLGSGLGLTPSSVGGIGFGGKWLITRVTPMPAFPLFCPQKKPGLGLGLMPSSGGGFGLSGKVGWVINGSSSMSTFPSFRPPQEQPGLGLGLGLASSSSGGRGFGGEVGGTDITRLNFWSALQGFRKDILVADFVALDLELTGIHNFSTPDNGTSTVDPCQERYLRIKEMAEIFAIVQAGISLFKWDPACNKLIACPYNFFIFSQNGHLLNNKSHNFLCEPSSLWFLAKHNFDFTKCFRDGISYLSKEQEKILRDNLCLDSKNKGSRGSQPSSNFQMSSSADYIFFEKVLSQISSWHGKVQMTMAKMQHPADGFSTIVPEDLNCIYDVVKQNTPQPIVSSRYKLYSGYISSSRPFLLLKLYSDRQVKIVQLIVRRYFQGIVPVEGIEDHTKRPMQGRELKLVFSQSQEDRLLLEKELDKLDNDAFESKLNEAVGFRHVIDAIINSKKAVIGHNCLIDLAHIYSKFISPLPSTVAEFSSSLLNLCPCIIDTKYLLVSHPEFLRKSGLKNTSLETAFQFFCGGVSRLQTHSSAARENKAWVEIDVANGFKRYGHEANEIFQHEAGYDAFMTGSVFIQACHYAGIDPSTIGNVEANSSQLSGYANRLWIGSHRKSALDLKLGREVFPTFNVGNWNASPPKTDYKLTEAMATSAHT